MPRVAQIVVAALTITVALPLLFFGSLVSFLCVGLPPLYASERVGQYGRRYVHLKLRTMKPGNSTGRVFFEQERINACGRLLRKLHIDEIPELFHILTGKMNLVGPRPLPARLLAGLDTSARETAKPGWTGPAQVYLARHGRLDKRLQIRLDNHYLKNQSTLYDVKIVLATFSAVFKGKSLDMKTDSSKDRVAFQRDLKVGRP